MLHLLVIAQLSITCASPQQVCFSPTGHCDQQVIQVIDRAQRNLDLAIYSINHPAIVDAILAAKKRGVAVRMLVDRSQSSTPTEAPELHRLLEAGVAVKRNTRTRIMHLKVAVADQAVVAYGSFNWTTAATSKNDEILVVTECGGLAGEIEKEFEKRWNSFMVLH